MAIYAFIASQTYHSYLSLRSGQNSWAQAFSQAIVRGENRTFEKNTLYKYKKPSYDWLYLLERSPTQQLGLRLANELVTLTRTGRRRELARKGKNFY